MIALTLQVLVPVLAFLAALGAVYVALAHYRPALKEALARQEAEVATTLSVLYLREWSPKSFVRLRFVVAPAAAVAVFLISKSWVFALLIGLVIFVLPQIFLEQARNRRRERLEAQVSELINSLVATAKSGMNLHQSLNDIANRLPPPIAQECKIILRRLEAGQSMEATLLEADARLGIPNLSLVIQSLVVNERRGGKLPALLERIGQSLREIERVEERVKTETSGIKLSSRIMAAMPLLVCFLLYLASPEHVLMLFETTLGNILLVAALALDYVGFTMIRKLGELEV